MKSVFLTNDINGFYNFRREVVEAFLKECDVVIFAPIGERTSYFKKLGCKMISVKIERHGINPINDIKLMQQYLKNLRIEKPDIVYTYTIKPNIYGGIICSFMRIPYVPNITGLGTAVEKPGLLQMITINLYRFALRKAKKVFFQNSSNMDFMICKKVVKKRYDLLPGSGVNLNDFTVSDYPDDHSIDFAFISRIMKEKGIDQYLEAALFIRSKYPQTRFHVCGYCEQNYEEKLKKLDEEGIIIYHGLVKNMNLIYEQVHCTVHPSYYPEGLSNVLLESCASGRPIITTNRPGCREVVENGKNGFIVVERDSQDLIEKIEQFLLLSNQERKNMGLVGRTKVEREFDRHIVINKYLEELKNGL